MPGETILQGRLVRVNIPVFAGTNTVVQSAVCRLMVDMSTRHLVLTLNHPTQSQLFCIEQRRSDIETVGTEALEKAECVAKLQEFLDSKPDVELVGVYFPYMQCVCEGRLVGSNHQAVVLYNAAAQDGPAVILANFLHGTQQERDHRIHLTNNDYLVGNQAGQNPPGDIDVVKLFSLPDVPRRSWWEWQQRNGDGHPIALRNGQAVRAQIVTALINLAQADPLVYPEEDHKPSKVRAIEHVIMKHEGVEQRLLEHVIVDVLM